MTFSMQRRLFLAGFASLALLAGHAAAQDKAVKIAVSVPSLSFPWYVHMQNEFQAEAKELGNVELIILDGQNSAPKQTSDVEAAVVQHVDALVIAPIDVNALAPALDETIAAKIPVVTFDRSASGVEGILLHVGADNVKGGEVQGEQVIKDFPDGATIFNIQGQPGSGPGIERNKGLHLALDKVKEKYKIVFEQTANFARSESLSVTETGLTAQGTPKVIVAANDDMALGAAEALKAANIDSVKIYGFDALPDSLSMIRGGSIHATIEQRPGEQAKTALRAAVDFVRNGTKPAEPVQLLEPFAITQANLEKAERISEVK
jgi:inositol transport system substrate-binding protein